MENNQHKIHTKKNSVERKIVSFAGSIQQKRKNKLEKK